MVAKHPSISVFFPCYNDSRSIPRLVRDADRILKKISSDYEITVIDDGSKDNSREVLKKLLNKYKNLRLIFHDKNKGYGAVLKTGFKISSKDLIFYTDGDGQYDVGELPLLVALMTDDVDFVNGIKMDRQDPGYRIFLGNLHKFFTRWLFWLPIYDTDCDFRLIRKNTISKINLTSDSGSICPELVKKAQRAGASFREVSVHHYPRKHGQSQFFRPGKIVATYLDLLALWIRLMLFR